jgi:hypothetical protein
MYRFHDDGDVKRIRPLNDIGGSRLHRDCGAREVLLDTVSLNVRGERRF